VLLVFQCTRRTWCICVTCRGATLPPSHPARLLSPSSSWCRFGWEGRPSTRPTSTVSRSELLCVHPTHPQNPLSSLESCFLKNCVAELEFSLASLKSFWKHPCSFPEHPKAGLLYWNHRGQTEALTLLHWLPRWELFFFLCFKNNIVIPKEDFVFFGNSQQEPGPWSSCLVARVGYCRAECTTYYCIVLFSGHLCNIQSSSFLFSRSPSLFPEAPLSQSSTLWIGDDGETGLAGLQYFFFKLGADNLL